MVKRFCVGLFCLHGMDEENVVNRLDQQKTPAFCGFIAFGRVSFCPVVLEGHKLYNVSDLYNCNHAI